MKQNPATSIKCKFSNAVHKLLEPNIDKKTRLRWRFKKEYLNEEKLAIFEQIMALHAECSKELTSYQYKKRQKKRVDKARVERGWVPKKKTKKA